MQPSAGATGLELGSGGRSAGGWQWRWVGLGDYEAEGMGIDLGLSVQLWPCGLTGPRRLVAGLSYISSISSNLGIEGVYTRITRNKSGFWKSYQIVFGYFGFMFKYRVRKNYAQG